VMRPENAEPAPCYDCGVDTFDIDGRAEWYMVWDYVWEQAGMYRGFLCIGCLEERLSRTLNSTDFELVPVNDANYRDATTSYSWRTDRLQDRLTRRPGD